MGLLGMMARTAVVAGTATAVSGRVSRRQQAKYQQKADAQAYNEQQAHRGAAGSRAVPAGTAAVPAGAPAVPAGTAAVPAAAVPAAAAVPGRRRQRLSPNLVDEIQRLSTLKDQGILSEDEFTAAKTKLLGL